MISVQRQWYVVQAQANAENKATTHLARQVYDIFAALPKRRSTHDVDVVAAPLFPAIFS